MKNNTLSNIVKVTFSNILKLLAGVLVGFLLPKIIGVTDYGLYKTFTLYATYSGLLVLGISDGIYLKFGGKTYDELIEGNFFSYTRILLYTQLFFSSLLSLIISLSLEGDLRLIFIFLSVYIIFNNMTTYYQMISQITFRFNELSIRIILQSIFTSVIVIFLTILFKFFNINIRYWHYISLYLVMFAILTIWYSLTYKDITFKKGRITKQDVKDVLFFARIGIPLLISNLCSTLILTIDRQFVNILFPTDTYAIYAFAYNMLALITTATASISTVLYPVFKRRDLNEITQNYNMYSSYTIIFISLCLLVYYPLCWFIGFFLNQYNDSLLIFRIVLPGLLFSGPITILMHNYYKISNRNNVFFIKGIIVLLVSIIANIFVYMIWKNTISISIISIVVMVFWYLFIDFGIKDVCLKGRMKNFFFAVLILISFYLITIIDIIWVGFILQIFITLSLIFAFFYKELKLLFKKVFKKGNEL